VRTKLFKAACAALWGPQYRSPGARELGIGLRTMMRYDAGERDVPAALMDKLHALLVIRHREVEKLLPKVAASGSEETT